MHNNARQQFVWATATNCCVNVRAYRISALGVCVTVCVCVWYVVIEFEGSPHG